MFDEPLSNLDARLREQMRYEIRKLQRDLGTTSLYVTHDQMEAMTMADRMVAMYEGVAQQIGTPADLYANPANLFVAGFIGAPAMNFLDATLRNATEVFVGALRLGQVSRLRGAPEDGRVTVGIRPERISVDTPAQGLPARIDFLEPTGPGTILNLRLEGQRIKAFTTARVGFALQEPVGLSIGPRDLLLFDPGTGLRLPAA